ncbi:MAG: efflux RND transporter permease subunit, partial [SAR324 cluster bacterium]|nr:efflux RND transporter permease subunit [SAR324 cluster bacterium]
MKTGLIEFFTRHPTAANLLMIFFLLLGAMALPEMRRETFPDFTVGIVQVSVVYPGASAEDVEAGICQPIQDAIDGIRNVAELKCESRENIGIARIEWNESGKFDEFVEDINTEINALQSFPANAEDPVIKRLNRTDRVASLALTGPMPPASLKAYAEDLKDRLQQTGISLVEIDGFSDHQLRIELSQDMLQKHKLTVADVAGVIQRQSVDLPVGGLETRDQEITVRFADQRMTPAEFESLIILGRESGAEIHLGDLATITDRFEKDEVKITFDGKRAALLHINKTKSQDSLDIGNQLLRFLEAERKVSPPGIELHITGNMFSVVQDRLNMLVSNGFQGFILVLLTLWLFFSLRFAFWVAMGLPVSFMGTFFVMQAMDMSLNMFTMVGLLIALGLLMDDAIVISENIASRLKQGKSAINAAVEGAREMGIGVFSSFLTTVSIFGPLIFLEGNIGKVLKVMPVVLIVTLLVSLIEVFFILPNHLSHSLAHMENFTPGRFRVKFDEMLDKTREGFGRWVDVVIEWRYLFLGGMVGIFLISIGLLAGGIVKFTVFPDMEGDIMEARILLPPGTPLTRTEKVVDQLVVAMHEIDKEFTPQQPEGQSLVKHIRVDYNRNADANESGPHVATVIVDLLSTDRRNARLDDLFKEWRARTSSITDVSIIQFKESSIGPAGLPIDIQLKGNDYQLLKQASQAVQEWFRQYDGVVDLTDDLRPGKQEMRLKLKEGALAMGFDANTIAGQLRASFLNANVGNVYTGEESFEIDVRLQQSDKDSLTDLEYFNLINRAGQSIPLQTVVEIQYHQGFSRLQRVDRVRTVTIQGDLDLSKLNTAELLGRFQKEFLPEFHKKFPEVSVQLGGESKEGAKTQKSMLRAFLIGIAGIFIILSFQFKSYVEPLIVMLAIPMAMIGVIFGHLLMGLNIGMTSLMGFVSLAGVVVNDSILLVEFLKMHIGNGERVFDAARQASRDRFRAIMLTSLTTIAGAMPLLFETSTQAMTLIPMVTSIIFGLLASTVSV